MQVILPTNVNVVVHAHASAGTVIDNGQPAFHEYGTNRDNGISVNKNYTIPAQGTADGTIVLNLKVGIGDVNINSGTGD
jgi:hypothetical protein